MLRYVFRYITHTVDVDAEGFTLLIIQLLCVPLHVIRRHIDYERVEQALQVSSRDFSQRNSMECPTPEAEMFLKKLESDEVLRFVVILGVGRTKVFLVTHNHGLLWHHEV